MLRGVEFAPEQRHSPPPQMRMQTISIFKS